MQTHRSSDRSRSRKRWLSLCAATFAVMLASGSSSAALMSFTASGTGADGALSANADFTTSAGQLVVALTNTLSASVFRSPGQALSDISFTLSSAPGTTSFGTSTASGQFGDISSLGVVTFVAVDTQTGQASPLRWFLNGSIVGNTITLEAIGGGQPSQMIAPGIADGGTYANANAGLRNFNSYIIGPATFTLLLPGVTEATTVSEVTFSFGTGPDTFIPGVPPLIVPEPTTVALLGIALVALASTRRRRSR